MDPVLQSTIEIENKQYTVTLTNSVIYWDNARSSGAYNGQSSESVSKPNTNDSPEQKNTRHDIHLIDLRDVITVTSEKKRSGRARETRGLELMSLNSTCTTFIVYIIRRITKHRWRDRKILFQCRDAKTCQLWVSKIQDCLFAPEYNRPRKLLVFVNPHGGLRKGQKIYAEKVAPLLELAAVSTEVVVTKRANHARDMLLECNLKHYDGVVCVGGDGMFSELLHGLLLRKRMDLGLMENGPRNQQYCPDIRIGIIPAGSTDTVSHCCHGYNDPITSALHIILGDSRGIDVFSVHQGNQFLRYGATLMGYGFYGDIIKESEDLRWMGPKRYDYLGVKNFCRNKLYEGEVSFLPSSNMKDSHPRDGTRCHAGCEVCHEASQLHREKEGADSGSESMGNWRRIRGRFVSVNAYNMSCRCAKSPDGATPSGHLGDGYADLVLTSNCSRVNFLRHLMRTAKKDSDQFDFNFIQVHRVKEFKFKPLIEDMEEQVSESSNDGEQRLRRSSTHNSVWNCDGECLDQASVHVKVHCQLIKLFCRGIEEEVKEDCASLCVSTCGRTKDRFSFSRSYVI
ncbi:ceramide kinase-like isoform X2 [Lineus longissimus]|uniref:ceramide kinase-like isoform X2 n=1 Tax=Lineus longissimus TaxID=88925 RepID=UPI00315D88BA